MLFSFARNSCHRNHARYTLCAYHHAEQHPGEWQTCSRCRQSFATELYVWYGTNQYNFAKLPNPPAYEPTHCAACGRVIRLGEDGYTLMPDGRYICMWCAHFAERPGAARARRAPPARTKPGAARSRRPGKE